MDRYEVVNNNSKAYSSIRDTKPKKSWVNDVCTIYHASSPLTPAQIAEALNIYDSLIKLPATATKAQLLKAIGRNS